MVKDPLPLPHAGLDILEKGLAPGKHLTKHRVLVIAPRQDGMAQQGEQVEAKHTRRERLLAMTKVVRQVGPLGLEHVVVCVVDLPSPAARLGYVHTVVSRQRMRGDPAIVREWCTRCGVDDGAIRRCKMPLRTSKPRGVRLTISLLLWRSSP